MSNVSTLRPIAETIEFSGVAKKKIDNLIAHMLLALERFQRASDAAARDVAYGEITRLQDELAAVQAPVEFVQDVLDVANDERRQLWERLPNGQTGLLVARRMDGKFTAVLAVRRHVARIDCSEFFLIERTAGNQRRLVA